VSLLERRRGDRYLKIHPGAPFRVPADNDMHGQGRTLSQVVVLLNWHIGGPQLVILANQIALRLPKMEGGACSPDPVPRAVRALADGWRAIQGAPFDLTRGRLHRRSGGPTETLPGRKAETDSMKKAAPAQRE